MTSGVIKFSGPRYHSHELLVTDWSDAEISCLGEAIGKETAALKLLRGDSLGKIMATSVSETVLHTHLTKPRAVFSKIASHISEVGGSHGHSIVNSFKVFLW